MFMKKGIAIFVLAFAAMALAQQPAWLVKSNENAQLMIRLMAKYLPEGASNQSLFEFDEQISQPTEETQVRCKLDLRTCARELQSRLDKETDLRVKQDLEILIKAADRQIRNREINDKTFLPYQNVAELVFSGEKSLLDDQVTAERRSAAVIRLRKYTGLEPGFTPITRLAEERYLAKVKTPGLLGPPKQEVEKDLANTATYITGIGLFLREVWPEGLPGSLREAQRATCGI